MTAGLGLAVMPERTALASIAWAETRAVVRDVIGPAAGDVILEVIGQTGKTGIDCPFGGPDAFVCRRPPFAHVALLADGLGTGWRRPLTMRRTDTVAHDKLHLVPPSVATDRIAHDALRCAVLLAKLDAAGRPVDRTGAGTVVEACPAASLLRRGHHAVGVHHPERRGRDESAK